MRLDGVLRVPAAACVLTARSDSLAFSSYGRCCTNGCVRINANLAKATILQSSTTTAEHQHAHMLDCQWLGQSTCFLGVRRPPVARLED
jgi:hypothetical protein